MLRLITCLFICLATRIDAQEPAKETAVKAYYSGFEKHNWNLVAAQLADNFSFTSPNNDDHISIQKFKEKCWDTNRFFKKVKYVTMTGNGNNLFLLVEIITTENKVVRNVDFFSFNREGKIQSIEVFFGTGSKYPGNKK